MTSQSNPNRAILSIGAVGLGVVGLLALGVVYLPGAQTRDRAHAAEPPARPMEFDRASEPVLPPGQHQSPVATNEARYRIDESAPQSLEQLHRQMAVARSSLADRTAAIAEMDRKHAAEPLDAVWSAASELSISGASDSQVIRESGLLPLATATDCRSSTCRISATFADQDDAQSWGTALVTQMGRTLSQARMSIRTLADGRSEVLIYGTRRG